jgi:hypothetical protein
MVEGFAVSEGDVAGFGVMTSEIHGQTLATLVHVHEARPETGYDGLMALMSAPLSGYCDLTVDRIADRSRLVGALQGELNLAAWRYHTTDESVYTEMVAPRPPLPPIPVTRIRPFPNPVHYDPGAEPALDPPDHKEPPIQGLIEEVGGSIRVIDWAVEKVWESPVEAIVEPLAGNWTELERAAEVLTQVGDGLERVAENLTAQLGRLSGAWRGGAANACEDHVTRLAGALEIEGPINRLVAVVLGKLAGEIEQAAQFMVSTLRRAVDKIATAIATGWVPFVGWYKVYDTIRTVINVFQEAKALVESIRGTIATVQGVIDAASDPIGFVTGEAEEIIAPYAEGAEIANDLASLDPDAITEAPDDAYAVGANPRRDG